MCGLITMINLKYIFKIFSLFICVQALAIEENVVFLPDVVVSPNRVSTPIRKTSSSIVLINKENIEHSAATSSSSLLQEFGGFNVAGNGGKGADPSYFNRGLERKYIKILVDGMDLSDITSAQEEPTYIDFISINDLGSIEILNGSQGTLYGSNAIGGVITFNSKRPIKPGLENLFTAEFGSYGTLKTGNIIKFLDKTTSFKLGVNGERSHGYSSLRDDESTYLENDGYNSYNGKLLFDYNLRKNTKLNLGLRYTYHGNEYDDFYSTPGDTTSHVRHDKQFSGILNLTHITKNTEQQLILQPSRSSRINRTTATYEYDSIRKKIEYLINKKISSKFSMLAGSEYLKLNANMTGELASKEVYSIFSELRTSPTNKFSLEVSSRKEFNSNFDDYETGRIQANLNFSKGLQFKSSIGSGYRSPGMYELYSKLYGNKDLIPEKSLSIDFSFSYSPSNSSINISGGMFTNKIDDKIEFISDGYYNTIGQTKIKGYETALGFPFTNKIFFSTSYVQTNGKNDKGNKIKLVPKHKLVGSLIYDYDKYTNLNLYALYKNKSQDTSYKELPTYKTLNLRGNYKINYKSVIYVKLENFLNRRNEDNRGYSSPSRSIYFGIQYNM